MKKIAVWIHSKRENLLFAVVLNALVLAGMFFFMRPWYETNDDSNIAAFANGAYGVFDAHMIYVNYIAGLVFSKLYSIFGAHYPWYSLFQYFVLFVSFTLLTHIVLCKIEGGMGSLLSGLILLYFGYECYINVQYTKTAGIAASVGILLLFCAAEMGREKRGKAWAAGIFGMLLTLAGSMLRFKEFASCTALMSSIGVLLLLTLDRLKKGQRLRRVLKYGWIFGLMLVLTLGARLFDNAMYQNDEEWAYYKEYNELRMELLDLGFPEYEENQEGYEALGISKTAMQLYRGWNFNDPDKFNVETMKQIIAMKEKKTLSFDVLKEFLQTYPQGFLDIYVFGCVLLVLFAWIFWAKKDWRHWLTALYVFVILFGLYFYLFYLGRYGINRVDVGLMFAVIMPFLWMLFDSRRKLQQQTAAVVLLLALIVSQNTWRGVWRINAAADSAAKAFERDYMQVIADDREHLYFAKVGTLNLGNYGPFNHVPVGLLQNVVFMGGWETASATINGILENYGVTNPFRDCVGNENVYLVDNDIQSTVKYIREYYDENAEAEFVKDVGNFKIYRIVSGED